MRQRGLDYEELRKDVRPKGALELLGSDILGFFLDALFAGVVHNDVEPAETLHRLLNRTPAERSSPTSPRSE